MKDPKELEYELAYRHNYDWEEDDMDLEREAYGIIGSADPWDADFEG